MGQHATARDLHALHADERNRVAGLRKHEGAIRKRERLRLVEPLVQEPVAHEFGTPIPHQYEPTLSGDHLDPPGSKDSTGFAPGAIV